MDLIGLNTVLKLNEATVQEHIVAIAGLADIGVGETVCYNWTRQKLIPLLHVDEPTISNAVFGTNDFTICWSRW